MGAGASRLIQAEMDFFHSSSPLKLLFTGTTILYGGVALISAVTGKFCDKSGGNRRPDDPVGILSFRKKFGQLALVGSLWSGYLLVTCAGAYAYGWNPNVKVQHFLEWSSSPGSTLSTTSTATVLGLSACFLTQLRTLQESLKVHVFSGKQTLNVLQMLLSYTFVGAIPLAILAEAPALSQMEHWFVLKEIGVSQVAGVVLLLVSSYMQRNVYHSLAKLRRNRAGHIVTTAYKVPKGGWFDVISGPQYLAQVGVYSGIGLITGLSNSTYSLALAAITAHQFCLALKTHKLFTQKFDDYPGNRRVIIPYLL